VNHEPATTPSVQPANLFGSASSQSTELSDTSSASTRTIRVAIIDDDDFVRNVLSSFITKGGCEVVGQAKDGDQAVDLVHRTAPDVVIMDVRMERMDGITATALVKELPNPPGVIALTSFDSEATILDAVSVGVDGFLAKDSDPGEFVRAVRRVAAGEGWLSSRATRVVMESTRRGGRANSAAVQSRVSLLTSRELEAVRWLVTEGCSNADIAASMFISETSVKTHLGNAATKLGAKNRTHLAALAVQAGLAN
jgi:DNA-binding NarL/FixJ family response regulator